MKTEKALEVLVRELNKIHGSTLVKKDQWEQFIEGCPAERCCAVIGPEVQNVFTFSEGARLRGQVSKHLKRIGANYFVMEVVGAEGKGICAGTPYRLIRKEDESILREHCYSGRGGLLEAHLTLLAPEKFRGMLISYQQKGAEFISYSTMQQFAEAALEAREAHKRGKRTKYDRIKAGDLVYGVSEEGEQGFMFIRKREADSIDWYRGPIYTDPPCTNRVSKWGLFREKQVHKVEEEKKDVLHYFTTFEFLHFLFSLPEDVRDIKADKDILERLPHQSVVRELMRTTYLEQPELFPQFFPSITQEEQVELIRWITNLPEDERHADVDRQFLDMAYDGGCPEYHLLLTTDPEGFPVFFEGIENEEKQGIIDALYRLEEVPEIVMNTLSERYPDLVEEVGVHHVKEGEA